MAKTPHTPDHAKAWGDFWARNQGRGGDGGCLPEQWAGIGAVQKTTWVEFSNCLPQGAHVLDLATGDGRVMKWLLDTRRDLKLIGCDIAKTLPKHPKGTKVRAGVAMEDLPFADGQFGAAVSQFGFEYGDTETAAAESARVVKPGGFIGLMTHRKDGPILSHNLDRQVAIRWAITDQELIKKAKGSLQMRAMGGPPVPPLIAKAPAEGAAKFGDQSAAWEIAEAIRQTLVLGARDHPAGVAGTLDEIVRQAENEMGRIASLEAACENTASEAFEAAIAKAGLEPLSVEAVCEPNSDRAFADLRIFRRS